MQSRGMYQLWDSGLKSLDGDFRYSTRRRILCKRFVIIILIIQSLQSIASLYQSKTTMLNKLFQAQEGGNLLIGFLGRLVDKVSWWESGVVREPRRDRMSFCSVVVVARFGCHFRRRHLQV